MSDSPPPQVEPPAVDAVSWTMRCPLCDSELDYHQDWCLNCGAPARTRIAPTPNWRVPLVALVIALAISGAGLAYAFVKLSSGTGKVSSTATTAPAAATTLTAAPSTAPPVAPAATATPTVVTPTATTPPAATPTAPSTPAVTPTRTIPTNPPATIPGTTHP